MYHLKIPIGSTVRKGRKSARSKHTLAQTEEDAREMIPEGLLTLETVRLIRMSRDEA